MASRGTCGGTTVDKWEKGGYKGEPVLLGLLYGCHQQNFMLRQDTLQKTKTGRNPEHTEDANKVIAGA